MLPRPARCRTAGPGSLDTLRPMSRHPFLLLEVFAASPGTGNLLPVVLDADDLDEAAMGRLARRMQQSETSFVQTASDPASSYRHRIWTVAEELPFAGHPSVGTAVAVTLARDLEHAELVQQTGRGLQALSVQVAPDGMSGQASLRHAPLEVGPVLDVSGLLRAFGLAPDDAHPSLPAQVVSTGLPALVMPLRDVAAMGRLRMDPEPVSAALRALDIGDAGADKVLNCYFATPVDGPPASATEWRTRCLALDLPRYEDPATGSAAGPFGAWVATHGGPSRIRIVQGVEMGDRSDMDVDVGDGIVLSGPVLVRSRGWIEL